MALGARAAGRTDTTGLCPAMHHRHRHSEILRAWKTSENSATLKKAQEIESGCSSEHSDVGTQTTIVT